MGWIATAIMLYGSFLIGEKNKTGFLCQITGNSLWAIIGIQRGMQLDLITISVAFVALYVRNYRLWHRNDKKWRGKLDNKVCN
jgi:hypothetical protein